MTEKPNPEYLNLTLQQYGHYFETPAALEAVNSFRFESWIEQDRKRKAYLESPEGKAQLKREQEERDARWKREEKFRKRWQWLYDWLDSKGCQCDCGNY